MDQTRYRLGAKLQMNAEAAIGLKVGDIHPDFSLSDLDGRPVRLTDYRGRHLLIFMWASW